MKLSRSAVYAIRATVRLAEYDSKTPIPCSRLAADGAMPERFLLQILRNLVTHGILQSTRGVVGGYTLIRSPDEISVLDVIEAVEGPMGSDFSRVDGLNDVSKARLQSVLKQVASTTRRQLEAIKLSQIVQPVDSRVP